jgi:hypothetical protein
MAEPLVSMTFVAKPWWKRYFVALELAIFGSVLIVGSIIDVRENG